MLFDLMCDPPTQYGQDRTTLESPSVKRRVSRLRLESCGINAPGFVWINDRDVGYLTEPQCSGVESIEFRWNSGHFFDDLLHRQDPGKPLGRYAGESRCRDIKQGIPGADVPQVQAQEGTQ